MNSPAIWFELSCTVSLLLYIIILWGSGRFRTYRKPWGLHVFNSRFSTTFEILASVVIISVFTETEISIGVYFNLPMVWHGLVVKKYQWLLMSSLTFDLLINLILIAFILNIYAFLFEVEGTVNLFNYLLVFTLNVSNFLL